MEIYLDRIKVEERYKVFMGLVVPRPIAFVSTRSADGRFNAAPFSFFNIMCGNPATIVIGINHRENGRKDTYTHIEETGEFVVNVVSGAIAEAMNQCSLESSSDIDEFDLSGLTPVPSVLVKAPRVKEAPAHLECKLSQLVSISAEHKLIIANIVHVQADDALVGPTYRIDQEKLDAVGRMGGNSYTHTNKGIFVMERPDTDAVLAEYRKRKA